MENRFNLIDEPWIPIADVGRVSLGQLFGSPQYRALGGNPVQKIALMKLLLAIAQAAATPDDENGWQALSEADLAGSCQAYLAQWHHRFYLYGDAPFLQMPAIARAQVKSYGTVLAEIATGNTTVLSQGQQERALDDADKALLLVTQMGFALGGTKTDRSVRVRRGNKAELEAFKGKGKPSKPGPSIGFMGFLHNFVLGKTLHQTLRLNLLAHSDISSCALYPGGLGKPPWDLVPEGEDCDISKHYKTTLQGRLLPLSRFCLLTNEGLHYGEGLLHPDYAEGGIDPSIAIKRGGSKPKILWVNPSKRPWRELTGLLAFLAKKGEFECLQLRVAESRLRSHSGVFGIWSGGLSVSDKMGEQVIKAEDDYVESIVWLHADVLSGTFWYTNLTAEMSALDALARQLYACVLGYYKAQLVDGKALAEQATALFWQLCERHAQNLLDHCDKGEENRMARYALRKTFAANLRAAFDQLCPNQTARQLDAWAQNRPNPAKYLQQEAP